MKRTNIYLPLKQWESLRKCRRRTGLSVSELIRRAVDQFLAQEREEIHA